MSVYRVKTIQAVVAEAVKASSTLAV
jgi:hypothetical protein